MYAIMDVKMTDNLWIRIDKGIISIFFDLTTLANDISFSRFFKLDQNNGNVLTSFQLTNKSTGLILKAYQVYFISNDELIISLDSNQTYNKFGFTQNSKQDSVILKVNVTSGSMLVNSIWDIQNGMEYSTTIEFESDLMYQLGMKDDIYLFVKMHNLTNLSLLNQKVYLPASPNVFTGYRSFHSYGIAGNNIVSIYTSYIDTFWILLIEKNSLSIVKYWSTTFSSKAVTTAKLWIYPYSKS